MEYEKLKLFLRSEKNLLYALLAIGAICLIMGFTVGRLSKGDPKPEVMIDTVLVDKPIVLGGTLTSNTIIKPEKVVKPLPSVTKFKIGDLACAWGKWSGVVDDIVWTSTDESQSVLKYNLQHFNESTQEWELENWYYESELSIGKCN